MSRALSGLYTTASRRPLLISVILAAVARIGFATTSFVVHHTGLFWDEHHYLSLARTIAAGGTAESWYPGYGQSLYDSTRAFTGPLVVLTELFGPSRIVGQLLAAAMGILVVIVVVRIARTTMSAPLSLACGVVVAVMPSQVVWSSVVLRESMVWLCLAVIALAVTQTISARGAALAGWVGLGVAAVSALGLLRGQTLLAACWALVPAVALSGGRRLALRVGVAALIALTAPMLVGLGVGGIGLVSEASDSLGVTRANLSLDADSSTVDLEPVDGEVDANAPGASDDCDGAGGVMTIACRDGQATGSDDDRVVSATDGRRFVVEEGFAATVAYLPRGFAASVLQPLPWEAARTKSMLFAKLENLAWYVLYGLALIGLVLGGWQRRATLAYPVVVTGALVAISSVTQGNIGTAFRHRGQVLWAVAVVAMVGVAELGARRARRARL